MRALAIAAALALSACSVEMPLMDKPAEPATPVAQATATPKFADIAGASPAKMVRAAAATCLDAGTDYAAAAAQFRGAGWTGPDATLVKPVQDGQEFITVALDPAGKTCRVATETISIYEARAIARDLARSFYPTSNTGLRGACAGYEFRDPRGPISLNYGGATPASPCPDANGAAIILRGPLG